MESTEAGKLNVCLTDDPRQRLTDLTRNGMAPVKKVRHARILLLVDVNHLDGWRADEYIAAALGIHVNTVKRTRWKFVPEGEAQSLERKRRQTPPVAPKIDGHVPSPPRGDLLLTGPARPCPMDLEATGRGVGASPGGHVDLRRVRPSRAQKNDLRPWRKQCWCVPLGDAARFVAQMEGVLDLYAAEHTEEEPLICMDEASKQLLGGEHEPIAVSPGHPVKEDYHYRRQGVEALFMFFDPVRGWRRVSCRQSRTRVDWAEEVRRLLEDDYPQARKVKLVCDNLNTRHVGSLYEAFEPDLARRLESTTRRATAAG